MASTTINAWAKRTDYGHLTILAFLSSVFASMSFSMRMNEVPIDRRIVPLFIMLAGFSTIGMIFWQQKRLFAKITFFEDRLVLSGFGRPKNGKVLAYSDIQSWHCEEARMRGGWYEGRIFFTMKDAAPEMLRCSTSEPHGPAIVAELTRRMAKQDR